MSPGGTNDRHRGDGSLVTRVRKSAQQPMWPRFTRPMANRSRTVVALLACAALLPACRTANDTLQSPSDLVVGLLTVDDVGTDWRETQRDAFDRREQENPVLDDHQFCTAGATDAGRLTGLAGQAGADVEMQEKDSSRRLRLQAWSNNDVDEFFDAAQAAAEACDNTEWTDVDGVTYSFDVIDGPDIGDDVIHWKVLASPPAGKPEKVFGAAGRTTVARYGKTLMLLEAGDFAPDAALQLMSQEEWAEIVNRAGSKIDSL